MTTNPGNAWKTKRYKGDEGKGHEENSWDVGKSKSAFKGIPQQESYVDEKTGAKQTKQWKEGVLQKCRKAAQAAVKDM